MIKKIENHSNICGVACILSKMSTEQDREENKGVTPEIIDESQGASGGSNVPTSPTIAKSKGYKKTIFL